MKSLADLKTPADAIKALEEVVEGKEDFVYNNGEDIGTATCSYTVNGQPSCIVGHVLFLHGEPVRNMRYYNQESIDEIGPHLGLSDDVISVLTAAQATQDRLKPWGLALMAAKAAKQAIEDGVEDYDFFQIYSPV